MIKRIDESLELALRIIASEEQVGVDKNAINILLESGYISIKYGGGWMLSSKGRQYLKTLKTK